MLCRCGLGSAPASNPACGATNNQHREGTGHLPQCAETPFCLDKHRCSSPWPHHTFPHCWLLLVHQRHRQPNPEICFARGAPHGPGSPTPRNRPHARLSLHTGPPQSPPKPLPGDKTTSAPLSPGGRNFLPWEQFGEGAKCRGWAGEFSQGPLLSRVGVYVHRQRV